MYTKLRILFIMLVFFSLSRNAIALEQTRYQSGFQEVTIMDEQRPLQVAIWYPTDQQTPLEKIGENIIFEGESAVRNAKIVGKNHPLIVVSHGFSGSWRNQVWLGGALSRHGYIVAAPNHPGTTTQNMDRTVAQNMLERPNDIRRTLTYLLSDKMFSATINQEKIGVVGHSYGGWTAVELIGGRFSANQFEKSCQKYPFLASCEMYKQQMQGLDKESDYFILDKDMQDPRIRAAFIFDLGLARGFTASSLANIRVPTLVVSSGDFNKTVPRELESEYLLEHMPPQTTEYLSFDAATHFSFISICKDNAIEILQEEEIDDSYICEQDTKQRKEIHQLLVDKILSYMNTLK